MPETWEDLFRKWTGRLLIDPGWDIKIVADPNLDAIATATVASEHRRVSFCYRTSNPPDNHAACHEVCHALVHPTYRVLCRYLEHPPASFEPFHCIYGYTNEEVVDTLARAFLKAYGEEA